MMNLYIEFIYLVRKSRTNDLFVSEKIANFGSETDSHLAGGRVNAHAVGSVGRGHSRSQFRTPRNSHKETLSRPVLTRGHPLSSQPQKRLQEKSFLPLTVWKDHPAMFFHPTQVMNQPRRGCSSS